MRATLTLVVGMGLLATACTTETTEDHGPTILTEVSQYPGPRPINPGISDAVIPGDPSWPVVSWTRLPVGTPAPTLESLLGKVVVILCFQHW